MLKEHPFRKTLQQRLWREACGDGFGVGQSDLSAGYRDLANLRQEDMNRLPGVSPSYRDNIN